MTSSTKVKVRPLLVTKGERRLGKTRIKAIVDNIKLTIVLPKRSILTFVKGVN